MTQNSHPDQSTSTVPHPDQREMRPAKEPRKSPRARGWIFVLGLLLIAAGAVFVRDVLVETSNISGKPWISPVTDWLGRVHWEKSYLVVAAIAIVVGVIILISALRPRTKTHVLVDGDASLWMRPMDVARACSARAGNLRGVLNARTVATRKRVVVTVTGDPDDPTIEQRVREACTPVVEMVDGISDLRIRLARPRSNQ